MQEALLYLGSVIIAGWGVAHLVATRGVLAGFGDLSADNGRILAMEWIVEGVALLAIAAFVTVTAATGSGSAAASAVYAVAIVTLVLLAIVSLFTGFRIRFLPFRLCPFVFLTSAALIAAGAWL